MPAARRALPIGRGVRFAADTGRDGSVRRSADDDCDVPTL